MIHHRLSAALAAALPTVSSSPQIDQPSCLTAPDRRSSPSKRYSTVGARRALSLRQITNCERYRHMGLPLSFIARRCRVSTSTVSRALNQAKNPYKSAPRA